MPTRKKAKGKTKAKRKKPPVAKATTRRKTAARKKPAKALVRHSSPKKATPTANAAVKPRPSGPSVLSVAVTPMPSLHAQPRSAGGAYRRRDPLLQSPFSRDPTARVPVHCALAT